MRPAISRVLAALVSCVVVVAGGVAFASPAAAANDYVLLAVFEVNVSGTWHAFSESSSPLNPIPVGTYPSRLVVTNYDTVNSVDVSVTFADGGIGPSDCAAYTSGPDYLLGPSSSTQCLGTFTVAAGANTPTAHVQGDYPVFGLSDYNHLLYGFGVVDGITTDTMLMQYDDVPTVGIPGLPALQTMAAGFVPTVIFEYRTTSNVELTGVTYSSPQLPDIATACPWLQTGFSAAGGGADTSGGCSVELLNAATVAPQTLSITVAGTDFYGTPVSTTTSFSYAASNAGCSTPVGPFHPGQTVTVTCIGFEPGLTINAVLNSSPVPLGSFSTSTGSFSFPFVIPPTFTTGSHTVTVQLGTLVLATTPTFGVLQTLAATGVDATAPLSIAALAIIAGMAFLVFSRRTALFD